MARIPDPEQLRDAMWQPMSDDRRAEQQADLLAAVERAAAARPVVRSRRRWTVVAVAAALLALPAGMAFAAEGSLPGDALYPVKRVTETMRSWIDDDIVAQHRVDELEGLLAAGASTDRITDQIDRARIEVDRLDGDTDLGDRLEVAIRDSRDDVRAGTTTSLPSDRPAGTSTTIRQTDSPPTTIAQSTTTTTQKTDGSTTTITDATTTTVRDRHLIRVRGIVTAGPTCPVERDPPDPDCEDRPVAGAILVITDEAGREIGTVESDAEGRFSIRLEPGDYVLEPQPYDGLMGTAPPQEFAVTAEPVELFVGYDTGIR